jgi:DNA-binding transcriptional LysR family regulator
LLHGQADLAIGVPAQQLPSSSIHCELAGELEFAFCVAPHHPLANLPEPLNASQIAEHRIIAVADSARLLAPITFGVLPGQDVLTLPSMASKLEALLRGLGCGSLPAPMVRRHVEAGRLVRKATYEGRRTGTMHYGWRQNSTNGGHAPGKALAWWLDKLRNETTCKALLEQHEGLLL